VSVPGRLDEKLNEWWTENPWDIVMEGHNLSAYERKRAFLNVGRTDGSRDFLDISFLTGADVDGDGRCVVAGDFRNNGKQDVVLRQVGGGPLMLFENRLPTGHYLTVTLRGHKSNRLGIGARLMAKVGGRQVVREVYPLDSYRSQMPSRVHLGLGKDDHVDELTIRWPSGRVQKLTGLQGDRHVVIDEDREGADAVQAVTPGVTIQP
jgi:hypothetical protein